MSWKEISEDEFNDFLSSLPSFDTSGRERKTKSLNYEKYKEGFIESNENREDGVYKGFKVFHEVVRRFENVGEVKFVDDESCLKVIEVKGVDLGFVLEPSIDPSWMTDESDYNGWLNFCFAEMPGVDKDYLFFQESEFEGLKKSLERLECSLMKGFRGSRFFEGIPKTLSMVEDSVLIPEVEDCFLSNHLEEYCLIIKGIKSDYTDFYRDLEEVRGFELRPGGWKNFDEQYFNWWFFCKSFHLRYRNAKSWSEPGVIYHPIFPSKGSIRTDKLDFWNVESFDQGLVDDILGRTFLGNYLY